MTEPLDRRYDVEDLSTIDVDVLETFPYEYAGREIIMTIDTDEFTSVCPWSGLPDYARIHIEYIPGRTCIELRSLKYYFLSYRNVGIYQEHLVNRILDDLVHCAQASLDEGGGGLQRTRWSSYRRHTGIQGKEEEKVAHKRKTGGLSARGSGAALRVLRQKRRPPQHDGITDIPVNPSGLV